MTHEWPSDGWHRKLEEMILDDVEDTGPACGFEVMQRVARHMPTAGMNYKLRVHKIRAVETAADSELDRLLHEGLLATGDSGFTITDAGRARLKELSA